MVCRWNNWPDTEAGPCLPWRRPLAILDVALYIVTGGRRPQYTGSVGAGELIQMVTIIPCFLPAHPIGGVKANATREHWFFSSKRHPTQHRKTQRGGQENFPQISHE